MPQVDGYKKPVDLEGALNTLVPALFRVLYHAPRLMHELGKLPGGREGGAAQRLIGIFEGQLVVPQSNTADPERARRQPFKLVSPSQTYSALAMEREWPAKASEPYYELFSLADAGESARGGMRMTHVRVALAPAHDRRSHASDSAIDDLWEAKLKEATARGGTLFDASKFRLQHIGWADDNREGVTIQLGLTSYREYVATNLLVDESRKALEADGTARHKDPTAHLSNALGCEAVLVTSDAMAVLLRRSTAVATGTGLYNGPSGHAEPARAGVDAHVSDRTDRPSVLAAESRARLELFESIQQEVHEETNVPFASLSEALLIGAMADMTHKPDLLFVLKTSLTSEEVRRAYLEGGTEGWESDRLSFWPVGQHGLDTQSKREDGVVELEGDAARELHGAKRVEEAPALPLTAVTRAALAALTVQPGILQGLCSED
jgi:hypothetical protein